MSIDYNEPLPPTPPKRVRRKKIKAEDYNIEDILAAAKALGLSVTVPSTQEERVIKLSSKEKLGVISQEPPVEEKHPEFLTGTLHATHVVAGSTYGPGELVLPFSEQALFRTLLQQDQQCVRGYMDMRQYQPVSRCFIIEQGNQADRYNKFRKKEVSESIFNSERAFEEHVAVSAGQFDIAGYQPNFNSEAKPF